MVKFKYKSVLLVIICATSIRSEEFFENVANFEDGSLGNFSAQCNSNQNVSYRLSYIKDLDIPPPEFGEIVFSVNDETICLETIVDDLQKGFYLEFEYLTEDNSDGFGVNVLLESVPFSTKIFTVPPTVGRWEIFKKYIRFSIKTSSKIKLKYCTYCAYYTGHTDNRV